MVSAEDSAHITSGLKYLFSGFFIQTVGTQVSLSQESKILASRCYRIGHHSADKGISLSCSYFGGVQVARFCLPCHYLEWATSRSC